MTTVNLVLQSLKSGRTRTIGVVVPDITNPFFAAVVKGMESVSRSRRYRVLPANEPRRAGRGGTTAGEAGAEGKR